FGCEHARPVELAAVEQHAHEAAIIIRSRGETTTTDRFRYGESGLRRLQYDGAVHALARALLRGDEARALFLRHVVGRVRHLERGEDVLAEIVLEFLA